MVLSLHKSNVYIKKKLQVWIVRKSFPLLGAKTSLTCAGLQITPSQVSQCRAENGNLQKTGLSLAMVPRFHRSNVYIKRKLRVWRVQKWIPLVGGKTAPTCAGLQTTLSDVRQHSPDNGNSGLLFAMVPCLHQSNVYIKRKLRVWRVQKWIPLVCAKTTLTCVGPQTTPSDVMQYRSENGNSGLLFAVIPCLHQSNVYLKEDSDMECPEMYFSSRFKNRTYLCGPANYPVSCEAV